MTGRMIPITAANGVTFSGYLATPECGSGPGLVLLQEILGVNEHMRAVADLYAEEGYVVLAPDLFWRIKPGIELGYSEADLQTAFGYNERFDAGQAVRDVGDAVKTLRTNRACGGKVGALGFCLGGKLAYLAAARLDIDAAVGYYGVGIEQYIGEAKSIKCPVALHFGALDEYVPAAARETIKTALAAHDEVEIYVYPDAGHGFNHWDAPPRYHRPSASLAHSRTIGLLRRAIGPRYDLDALWERHTDYEFSIRDAAATMKTMVAEPYVNHVPTMTGGFGQSNLYRFYANHFIPRLPKDTKIVSVSRTVGADRLVDELLFCFTHDTEIDFLLPGVPPTGKYVEIPTVAIVQFRGDKLFNEHIYWDQATALVQIGLLDPKGLPVAGIETAAKIRDESLPMNTLMARWKESAPKK
ncbi:MAG: dienelactone hydrolase family protein [Candidatus Binataceae bacterium]